MNILLIVLFFLFGDEHHATMTGDVTQNGAPAVGVQVILQLEVCDCQACDDPSACNCCPGLTLTVTDGKGHYTITVPPGTYSVRVKQADRQPLRWSNVEFKAGDVMKKNFEL